MVTQIAPYSVMHSLNLVVPMAVAIKLIGNRQTRSLLPFPYIVFLSNVHGHILFKGNCELSDEISDSEHIWIQNIVKSRYQKMRKYNRHGQIFDNPTQIAHIKPTRLIHIGKDKWEEQYKSWLSPMFKLQTVTMNADSSRQPSIL